MTVGCAVYWLGPPLSWLMVLEGPKQAIDEEGWQGPEQAIDEVLFGKAFTVIAFG